MKQGDDARSFSSNCIIAHDVRYNFLPFQEHFSSILWWIRIQCCSAAQALQFDYVGKFIWSDSSRRGIWLMSRKGRIKQHLREKAKWTSFAQHAKWSQLRRKMKEVTLQAGVKKYSEESWREYHRKFVWVKIFTQCELLWLTNHG